MECVASPQQLSTRNGAQMAHSPHHRHSFGYAVRWRVSFRTHCRTCFITIFRHSRNECSMWYHATGSYHGYVGIMTSGCDATLWLILVFSLFLNNWRFVFCVWDLHADSGADANNVIAILISLYSINIRLLPGVLECNVCTGMRRCLGFLKSKLSFNAPTVEVLQVEGMHTCAHAHCVSNNLL